MRDWVLFFAFHFSMWHSIEIFHSYFSSYYFLLIQLLVVLIMVSSQLLLCFLFFFLLQKRYIYIFSSKYKFVPCCEWTWKFFCLPPCGSQYSMNTLLQFEFYHFSNINAIPNYIFFWLEQFTWPQIILMKVKVITTAITAT